MTEFEQAQIKELKRIADALEDMNGINGALTMLSRTMEELGNCIDYQPNYTRYAQSDGYYFLRVGGHVGTD